MTQFVHDILLQCRADRVRRAAEFLKKNRVRCSAKDLAKSLNIRLHNMKNALSCEAFLRDYGIEKKIVKGEKLYSTERWCNVPEKNKYAELMLRFWSAYNSLRDSLNILDRFEISRICAEANLTQHEGYSCARIFSSHGFLLLDGAHVAPAQREKPKALNLFLTALRENRPMTLIEVNRAYDGTSSARTYVYQGILSSFKLSVDGESKPFFAWSHYDWSEHLPHGMGHLPSVTVLHKMLEDVLAHSLEDYAHLASTICETCDQIECFEG